MENGEGAQVHLVCSCPEEISGKHDGGSSTLVCGVVKNDGVIVTLRRPIGRTHERPWTPRMGGLIGKPQGVFRMPVGGGKTLGV